MPFCSFLPSYSSYYQMALCVFFQHVIILDYEPTGRSIIYFCIKTIYYTYNMYVYYVNNIICDVSVSCVQFSQERCMSERRRRRNEKKRKKQHQFKSDYFCILLSSSVLSQKKHIHILMFGGSAFLLFTLRIHVCAVRIGTYHVDDIIRLFLEV